VTCKSMMSTSPLSFMLAAMRVKPPFPEVPYSDSVTASFHGFRS
jgi:hypothetical protein